MDSGTVSDEGRKESIGSATKNGGKKWRIEEVFA